MTLTLLEIARRMFVRQIADYDPDPEVVEAAWQDQWLQTYWMRQAASVIGDYKELERQS